MPPKAKAKGGAKGGGKGKNAHQLAPQLPGGTVLKDYTKGEWKLGQPIGSGGFGLIYLAAKNSSGSVGPNADYVVKVEPHQNGPLFCELQFYLRVAKPELIKQWMSSKKLKTFGMPKFIAHGSYEDSKEKYRFMVMERFGSDLQKLFEENRKSLPRKTVITLGIRLLEVLEYIHDKEYCHADIKASNLLVGFQKSVANQVFLVDYGLAYRYTVDGKHKPYKVDPKWKHNGTIEFTSRDAHAGLTPSRRGDVEILGYCLLQWLCGVLPWEDKLGDPVYVEKQKNKYMDDIPGLMKKCFPGGDKPTEIEKLLHYINGLEYSERPAYDQCKKILQDGLKKLGFADDGKLEFAASGGAKAKAVATPKARAKGGRKRVASESDEENEDYVPSPSKRGRQRVASPAAAASPATKRGKPLAAKSPRGRKMPNGTASPDGDVARARLASPAVKKVKAVEVQPASSDSSLRKKVAARSPRAAATVSSDTRIRKNKVKVSVACQTSPGLKGLKRSRKGR